MNMLGVMEFFVLMLALGPGGAGQFQADALALVSSEGYLQHRGIEAAPEKLLEVLKNPVTDPKSSVLQLIAIRWLGENHTKLGAQAPAARTALEALARGDPGFAQDYARIVLAKLDGKPSLPLHFMPRGGLRGQAFDLFPDEVTLFGAADLRAPIGAAAPTVELAKTHEELRASVVGRLPPNVPKDLYMFVDTVGNVRIDRLAMGYAPVPGKDGPGRIYVRITGRGDTKRLADYIQSSLKTAKSELRKGPKGEEIRLLLADGRHDPSFAFIGAHDLIISGPMGPGEQETGSIALEQVLSVLNGKKPSVNKGPFAGSLAAAPEHARVLIYGLIPEEVQKNLAATPLGIAPASVAMNLSDAQDGATLIQLRASFERSEDATKFEANARLLLNHGKDGLKQLPFKVKTETIEALQKALDSVELKAGGQSCSAQLRLTPQTLRAVSNLFEEAMKNLR